MKKLSDEGKVEFCFEYEPVYPHGVSRGDPDSIRFTIIEGKMGQAQQHETFLGKMRAKLITKYALQPSEWAKLENLIYDGLDLKPELDRIDKLVEEKQPISRIFTPVSGSTMFKKSARRCSRLYINCNSALILLML